jgi:DNA repair protein RadC
MKQMLTKFKLQVIKEKEYEYNCISEQKISCPYDLMCLCSNILELTKEPEEVFSMLTLDIKNNITGYFEVSRGSIDSSIVHPREVFKRAILQNASSMILIHNHPSGETEPSHEDIVITNRLVECAKILGIRIVDHIIMGNEYLENHYSFREEGLL